MKKNALQWLHCLHLLKVLQNFPNVFRWPYIECIYIYKGYNFFLDLSLKYCLVTFFVSCYGLCFEVYFVWYKYCYPSFFSCPFSWNSFSILSLSVCVNVLFLGGSLVDNIYVGCVFFSIQLPYVFWLEHLFHLQLRLLLVGTYSLPFFPFVPVFLSLFLLLLKAVPLASLEMLVWWRYALFRRSSYPFQQHGWKWRTLC